MKLKLLNGEEFLNEIARNLEDLDYSYTVDYRENTVYHIDLEELHRFFSIVILLFTYIRNEATGQEYNSLYVCDQLGICTPYPINESLKTKLLGYIIFTEDKPIIIKS